MRKTNAARRRGSSGGGSDDKLNSAGADERKYNSAEIDAEGNGSIAITDGREQVAAIIQRPGGHLELAVPCHGAMVEAGRFRTRRAAMAAFSRLTRSRH